MTDLSVRQSLERFYSLHGELPPDLAGKVSPKLSRANTGNSNTFSIDSQAQRTRMRIEEKAIANIFKDPRITLEQRELISNAILNGRFEVVDSALEQLQLKSKPRIIPKDEYKQRIADLTVERHKLPKPNFLEVVTHSAPIPALSGEQVRTNRIAIQRQMGSPSERSPQTQTFNNSDKVQQSQKMNIKEIQNQLVAEHNRKRMERSKEEAMRKSEQARQLRELETASALKRLEVKKKLQEVRKSLRAHLVNNRDPQLGTIMRCVDESLIYHFMEKYQGFSMSVQAILTLVGNSLGTSLANDEVRINDSDDVLDDPPGTANTNYTSRTSDTMGSPSKRHQLSDRNLTRVSTQFSGKKQLPTLEFDDSRQNTPSVTPHRSPNHSRGRSRGLLDSAPTPGTIPRHDRSFSRGAISSNTREFQSTDSRTHPHASSSSSSHGHGRGAGSQSGRTGMSDAVTGIEPRRYRSERPLSPENNPAWGGGFRVVHPKIDGSHSPNKPLAPLQGSRPASVPHQQPHSHSHSHSQHNVSSVGGHSRTYKSAGQPHSSVLSLQNSQSLVVFGSENLRLSAEAMGFTPGEDNEFDDEASLGRGDNDRDDNNSVFSRRSVVSNDSYHTSVPSNAIAAMHEQLIEENILPSMQPEVVLSAEQVRDLGLHKKTFNQIMKEIHQHGSYQSQVSHETDPNLHTQPPQLSQYDDPPGQTPGTPGTPGPAPPISSAPSSPKSGKMKPPMETLKTSPSVNSIVTSLMSTSTPIKSLFVEPLSATIDVPPAPKTYNSLYGSVYSSADKERFQHLSAMEVERGEVRFGLEPPTHHRLTLSRPYEGGSPGRAPQHTELTKPPRAIKTREGRASDGTEALPAAPYDSYAEASHVQNAGVPAGSGLMLWRPRYRVSREGRYRAGQSRTRLKHSLKEGPAKKPFVSAA